MEINIPAHPPHPLRLALCGGGASAVLLLTALRSRFRGKIDVIVMEPRAQLGLGLAYSTQCPQHVLNTRAGNMSANDNPDDFLQWLRREHPRRPLNWTRNDFAPRQLYGQYLQACLREVRAAHNIRFRWLRTTADSVIAHQNEWEVVPAQGEPVRADVVILATGNEPPRALGTRAAPQALPFILDDPWDANSKTDIDHDARVLLVGTGLTAIDMVIELLHRGHTGPIYAVSRRGLVPRCHGVVTTTLDGCGMTLPTSLRELVRHVRSLIESDPRGSIWQNFVNELRSVAPTLWARWSVTERRRFLRHVRPFWDVHRHRLAPPVHARIVRAQKRGQLTILRGRIQQIEPLTFEKAVRVKLRQPSGERLLDVAHVINCSGPETNPRRASNHLLQSLISDLLAQPDPLGLGLAVDQESRVIAADGTAHRTMYALGPLSRGSRWEITALAEIREQASAVARKLTRDFAATAPERAARLGSLGNYRQSVA